jgi:hypothetical protein
MAELVFSAYTVVCFGINTLPTMLGIDEAKDCSKEKR